MLSDVLYREIKERMATGLSLNAAVNGNKALWQAFTRRVKKEKGPLKKAKPVKSNSYILPLQEEIPVKGGKLKIETRDLITQIRRGVAQLGERDAKWAQIGLKIFELERKGNFKTFTPEDYHDVLKTFGPKGKWVSYEEQMQRKKRKKEKKK